VTYHVETILILKSFAIFGAIMHDVMSATGKVWKIEVNPCHLRLRGVCVLVCFLQYDTYVDVMNMAKDLKNLTITFTSIGESCNHSYMVELLFCLIK
jgi:hypothetical protein